MAEHKDNQYHKIREALEEHHRKIVNTFNENHKIVLKNISNRGISLATAAIIAGSLIAASPTDIRKGLTEQKNVRENTNADNKIKQIIGNAKVLKIEQEAEIQNYLSNKFSLNLRVVLDGNRLNEVYGFTGAEQHLYRWPGDSLGKHDLQSSGIAPLKGSFGYFDNEEQEKYYVAVQLHELPDWNTEWHKLKPWYRYRKVFVYNPDNNKAVVAVIGDSGPAKWTGKTFGGSPEVMKHLERVDGSKKGRIIILFVDDKDNNIALGPVSNESYLAMKK